MAAGGDDQVRGRDARQGAIAAARGRAGGMDALAVGGVGGGEVGAQAAALDQGGAAARHALAVERSRGGAAGLAAVVMEGEGRGCDLLVEAARQRRAPALDGFGAEAAADQADEAGGDGGVEDDR